MCEPCAARMRVSVWAPCAARVNKFLLQWVRGPELVHIPSYQRTLGHTFATSHRSQMDALTVYWRKKNNCVNFSKAEQASHSLRRQEQCWKSKIFVLPQPAYSRSQLIVVSPRCTLTHPPSLPSLRPSPLPPLFLPVYLPLRSIRDVWLPTACLHSIRLYFKQLVQHHDIFFSFGNFETFYIIYFSPLLEILLLLDNIIFSCSLIYFPQRIWRK